MSKKLEDKQLQALYNMEDMTVYKNIDGKLEEVNKIEKEELIPTTFRLRSKSHGRFMHLYEQQKKNKGEFASDVIDSFFKWFAIDKCVTAEDITAKDKLIKEKDKTIKELEKQIKELENQVKELNNK